MFNIVGVCGGIIAMSNIVGGCGGIIAVFNIVGCVWRNHSNV